LLSLQKIVARLKPALAGARTRIRAKVTTAAWRPSITLLDNDKLKVSALKHESNYLTLCFTGIGHAFGGVDVQSEEFIRSSERATSLFIVDKQRSWGNDIDFIKIADLVSSFGDDKIINSIGNSMGGFLAILATKFVPITNCVAIVPQFSVHKSVFPSENRWDNYVNNIRNWRYIDLSDAFNDTTNYYVLAGRGGADDCHIERIPSKPNVRKILFKGHRFEHEVARALKADGKLYDVINDCFSGVDAKDIVSKNFRNSNYDVAYE
jgi:hypothetical protein